MGRYALLALIASLTLMLGVCGIFLYKYANANLAQASLTADVEERNSTQSAKNARGGWMDNLAAIDKKDYILPTNEIFIEYGRPKNEPKRVSAYELVIDKNDVYSVFGLMQTLKGAAVDFTVVKDGVKSQIFLNTQDSKLLQHIIIKLRDYNINSSVREVKL